MSACAAAESWAVLVHVRPQRVRLRSPLLVGRPEVCHRIAQRLVQLPGPHQKVTIQPVSGSVVVEAKDDRIEPETLLVQLRECLGAEVDEEGRPLCESPLLSAVGPTKIAHSVARAFAAMNADVRSNFEQRADLGALFPVFLATMGIVQIVVTRQVPAPAWYTLLWWSLRAFMNFNVKAGIATPAPTPTEDKPQEKPSENVTP